MRQVVIGDLEALAYRRRIVRDEHVGAAHESIEHFAPGIGAQVERQTLLVAAVEHEAGVDRRPTRYRYGTAAIRVPCDGRLDLDDFGPEIGHHGRRRRPRDKARAIDDLDPVENALGHRQCPF
jgi:hypothetical protein